MAIELKNIDFSYSNNKSEKVLNNFSCTIENRNIVSILGDSGSGKSTILRLIAGLESPNKGEIIINKKRLYDKGINVSPEDRCIGMVFQDYALFPHLTVKKNILFGLNKYDKKEKNARFKEIIEVVRLEGLEKRYPHELSGGQQQRVALARALAPKPSVLLLDEPFSNLDAALQSSIREEVKDILKRAQITAIFVTHDKEDAISIADRVIILEKGRISKQGMPKEILI